MSKVLSRDPAWLAHPTAGSTLFKPTNDSKAQDVKYDGPMRKIAHRGSELFVAVNNELRWSELGWLREEGERFERQHKGGWDMTQEEDNMAYRVLRTPVHRPITQLSVSPSGDYIAIATSHTCHICILPPTEHLRLHDTSNPIRLKSFQLGPTAHVLEQSPLASTIWHPLCAVGSTLVTVTQDACVRLWELDGGNRTTFDEPALAVDLKKLGNATSTQADLSASRYGTNRGFSPDLVEMQVAAACFGGQGAADEHGWASMTLWVAMMEGDVYALCPFLPRKWRAPASLLASLSTNMAEKLRAVGNDSQASDAERRVVDQQRKWLAEVDEQEPVVVSGPTDFHNVEVYTRPESLSPVPKLQGPFSISPESEFGSITDIHVVASKIDDEALYDGEYDEEEHSEEGLSVSIVCLATNSGEVHVCLDLDDVEAAWLPNKRSRAFTFDDADADKTLLRFETISFGESKGGFPAFTASPIDRYELFLTHPNGVHVLSFRPWISLLEDELTNFSDNGADLRLNAVLECESTLINQPVDDANLSDPTIDTAIALCDSSVGYIVLTTSHTSLYATLLNTPALNPNPYAPDHPHPALPAPEPRAPYRIPSEFSQPITLTKTLRAANERELGTSKAKSQLRLSVATSRLMNEAHRQIADETHRLGVAAADLFRRCERMRTELHGQVLKARQVADKVDSVAGPEEPELDADGKEVPAGTKKLDARVRASRDRGRALSERIDALRRKTGRLGGKALTAREVDFAQEIERLGRSVLPSQQQREGGEQQDGGAGEEAKDEDEGAAELSARYHAVTELQRTLLEQAREVEGRSQAEGEKGVQPASVSGPSDRFRRQKLEQVWTLLEREGALVEAVGERLEKLGKRA